MKLLGLHLPSSTHICLEKAWMTTGVLLWRGEHELPPVRSELVLMTLGDKFIGELV